MALKDYPEWVLRHKDKGKELRCINGKYYLYLVHSKRVDGKVKKFTDKYLGRITEEGLIPPVEKSIKYVVKEYGLTAFIYSTCDTIIKSILIQYPSRSNKLIPLAILKFFFNDDINDFNKHYLSIIYPNVVIKTEKESIRNEIDRICRMINHSVSKILKNITLQDFKKSISSLYIVGVKDNWTIASYGDDIKCLLEKYNINLEINYGKVK